MFKAAKHKFPEDPNGNEKFIFRKPTIRDGTRIIAEKQKICLSLGVIPDLMASNDFEILGEIARLHVCLEKAPDEYWTEIEVEVSPGKKEKKRIISIAGNENIDEDEITDVLDEVRTFLFQFRKRLNQRPVPAGTSGP